MSYISADVYIIMISYFTCTVKHMLHEITKKLCCNILSKNASWVTHAYSLCIHFIRDECSSVKSVCMGSDDAKM
jgi:hypothetical protein